MVAHKKALLVYLSWLIQNEPTTFEHLPDYV